MLVFTAGSRDSKAAHGTGVGRFKDRAPFPKSVGARFPTGVPQRTVILHWNVHSSFIRRKFLQTGFCPRRQRPGTVTQLEHERVIVFKAQSERLKRLGVYEPERRKAGRQTELHLLARG